MRLRAGKTGSGKGAGRMVAQAIGTARAVSAHATILVRGDSMYGSRAVVGTCVRHGAQFSLAMTRNAAIERAIAAIPEAAWTPVRYPGAVQDPDTGAWISDAEVAEIGYTAFASTPDRITARLLVRRVKDARYRDALFPVWRYHPFFTNTDLPIEQADITHRQHAIIETVFADLIDGPLAHLPSGRFGANSAWILCAAIAHNLLRAAGVLAGQQHARARGSTLRRRIINVAARLARPQRRPMLHLPTHWPWVEPWLRLWHTTIGYSPPIIAQPVNPARHGPTGEHRKSWADQQPCHTHTINQDQTQPPHPHHLPISGSRLSVDISEPMLARAVRAEAGPQIGFLRADAQRLPLRDETVDAVVSIAVLQLVPDPAAALAEMARVLRPGGRLAVMVPTAGRAARFWRMLSNLSFAVMRRQRRRPVRSRGICGGRVDCGNACNSCCDKCSAELGEHVFEGGFVLVGVPGLVAAAAGEVVGVVAVQRVPDDDEAVNAEAQRHGAFHGALQALRAWPMPSSCLPEAMAVSIGQRCA